MSILSKSGILTVSKEAKYKESGQAETFFFLSTKLGGRVWKWSAVNERNTEGLHGQECLMRTRSVLEGFLTNSDSWDISPQHCLCASAHPAARALPLISGSQHWRAKCSPMGHWQVRYISLQTPTSHKVGVVAQWLLWSLLRGNIFWKAYEPFPCTEETTGRGVWDGLMGSLEIPKVLSKTCSSAATRTQSRGS